MVVVLAYVVLILFKHPAEVIEQGPERRGCGDRY